MRAAGGRPERLGAGRRAPARRRSTARRRRTSRWPGGRSPATRSSRAWRRSSGARATSSTTPRPRRDVGRCVLRARLLAAGRRAARSSCCSPRCCLFAPAVLAGDWAAARPRRRRRPRAVGLPRRHASPGRTAPTSASRRGEAARCLGEIFTNNIRVTLIALAGGADCGRRHARSCCSTTASLLGVVGGLALGLGERPARSSSSSPRTACSSCPASSSPARPGCASAGRCRARARGPAASRCGARRARAVAIVLGTAPWLVARRPGRGLRHAVGPAARRRVWRSALGLGVALLVARRLARRRARQRPQPRAFARRYALTQAAASASGARLDHVGAGAPQRLTRPGPAPSSTSSATAAA